MPTPLVSILDNIPCLRIKNRTYRVDGRKLSVELFHVTRIALMIRV
jgi:hypothetical protein